MTYATNAERQRAYRERYRQRIESRLETHEERIERIQMAIQELERLIQQSGLSVAQKTEAPHERQ